MNLMSSKTRYVALPASQDGIVQCLLVLAQYRRVLDRHTDRQREMLYLMQHAALMRAVKIVAYIQLSITGYSRNFLLES